MTKKLLLVWALLLFPSSGFTGAWSQKSGKLGLKFSYFSLVATKRYSTGGGFESRCLLEQTADCFLHPLESGVKIPVFSDLKGSARSRAVFLSADFGLLAGIELSAQIGYFSSENDFKAVVPGAIQTSSKGFSDTRVNLKFQYLKFNHWAGAVSGGFKAPTGKFNRNAFNLF